MILTVKPIQLLKGSIVLPASKSYSIRACFVAMGASGRSAIKNLSDCDDAKVAEALRKVFGSKQRAFEVGESGTSLRFLLPLLSFLDRPVTVKGKGTLIGRPNHHLCGTLRRQGMDIRGTGAVESVPIFYKGGSLEGGTIRIDGSLSSQFISALLIAAPRLPLDTRIEITGKELVSSDYITMTLQILERAGIKCRTKSQREIIVPGNQKFKPLRFHVPSDYGLAAFPMAAAALLPSKVTLKGYFDDALIQSDGHILEFLRHMGASFQRTGKAIVMQGPFALKGGTFSLKNCPDLVPIMSVLAMFAQGPTKLIDIHHARAKESDRISDLRKELLRVGAKVKESTGALTIIPSLNYKSGQTLDPHHDHRLAMAFTVLGLKIGCAIKDIECTHKSYPSFVKHMKILGLK